MMASSISVIIHDNIVRGPQNMSLPSIASLKKKHNPYECLERMLNKTTITTQRVAHRHIIDLGEGLLANTADTTKEEKEREIQNALEEAEFRATREIKAVIKRIRYEKEEERKRALSTQKEYYERLAKRISEQRDAAEAEREREITKKLEKEKEEALKKQYEECQRDKELAVKEACELVERKLRLEFEVEKLKAVNDALIKQKEKLLKKEKEAIERTIKECEERARIEAERVAKLHQKEIEKLNHKYEILEKKYHKELDHKRRVEQDFLELQDDYRRFMDYTDGKFHSDYLIKLRNFGMQLAQKRISEVNYNDIDEMFGEEQH